MEEKNTIRDWQEIGNSYAAKIAEIKDDVEEISKLEEKDSLMLFDLYQKLDDLAKGVDALIRLMVIEANSEEPKK